MEVFLHKTTIMFEIIGIGFNNNMLVLQSPQLFQTMTNALTVQPTVTLTPSVPTHLVDMTVHVMMDTAAMDTIVQVNSPSEYLYVTSKPSSVMTAISTLYLSSAMTLTAMTLTISDDDECTDGSANCDVNAQCTNTPGGYNCTCDDGYSGDGQECTGKLFAIE